MSYKQVLKQKEDHRLFPQQVCFASFLQIPERDIQQVIDEELAENPFLTVDENVEKKSTDDVYVTEGFVYKYKKDYFVNEHDYKNVFVLEEDFRQQVRVQLAVMDFSPKEKNIVEYIVENIDSDGFFDKDPSFVVNTLLLNTNEQFSEDEVLSVVNKIHHGPIFGLAVKGVHEFLLLQLSCCDDEISSLAYRVIADYWEDFLRGHYYKISRLLGVDRDKISVVCARIKTLKSYPLDNEKKNGDNTTKLILPDFFVYNNDGEVVVKLRFYNNINLKIENLYKNEIKKNKNNEAFVAFAKESIARAQRFIEALQRRRRVLLETMKTIVNLQRHFFLSGDIDTLKPMTIKNVAELSGVCLSTVSRVVNGKNVETAWGVFALKELFCGGIKIKGKEVNKNIVKNKIKKIISQEERLYPFSDDQIVKKLNAEGIFLSRRVVAKYRKQLQIPNSVIRKEG
ncbi:MAG: RNA polymerase factor sigma-54 [Cytophagales bacterium]|nr:RNA polymerase factor sigma-54 [Cytophagales bacterium]